MDPVSFYLNAISSATLCGVLLNAAVGELIASDRCRERETSSRTHSKRKMRKKEKEGKALEVRAACPFCVR